MRCFLDYLALLWHENELLFLSSIADIWQHLKGSEISISFKKVSSWIRQQNSTWIINSINNIWPFPHNNNTQKLVNRCEINFMSVLLGITIWWHLVEKLIFNSVREKMSINKVYNKAVIVNPCHQNENSSLFPLLHVFLIWKLLHWSRQSSLNDHFVYSHYLHAQVCIVMVRR